MKNATATTLIDRTTAVLSIRPVYADRILDGTKTIEFRRKPLPEHVERVLIWRTGKGGGFVGSFVVSGWTTLPAGSWECARGRGIEIADLSAYAGGRDSEVTGIYLYDVRVFPRTYAGWELGTDSAPQSFRYAHANWRDALLEAAKS